MAAHIEHWVDGKRVAGTSGRMSPVHNPATGLVSGEVDLASVDEVDAAVASAKAAFPDWRHASLSRRSAVLFAFRELLHDNADELAKIVTAEHGKVLSDAHGEIARGLENVEFACGVAAAAEGRVLRAGRHRRRRLLDPPAARAWSPASRRSTSRRWCRCGCAPNAIACGNAFILKPSEKDPSASLFLAELWKQAGLPDGVFTVVQGDKEAVDAILDPPGHRRGQLRRLDPDRALHLRDRHRARQARAGARRGEEPHAGAARRRHRHGRRRRRLGRLRLGRRALHGDLGRRGGRRRRRPRWSTRSRRGCPSCASATAPTPTPTWGR